MPSSKLTKTVNELEKIWYLPHFGVYHPRKPRKTADDGEEEFGHDAKDFVCNEFYVDDGLTSRCKPDEAVDLVKSTQAMLSTADLTSNPA